MKIYKPYSINAHGENVKLHLQVLKYIFFLAQTGQMQGGFLPPLKHYCED